MFDAVFGEAFRMPSGVAPLTILSPENAALASAKILGLSNPEIQKKIIDFQEKKRSELEAGSHPIEYRLTGHTPKNEARICPALR